MQTYLDNIMITEFTFSHFNVAKNYLLKQGITDPKLALFAYLHGDEFDQLSELIAAYKAKPESFKHAITQLASIIT